MTFTQVVRALARYRKSRALSDHSEESARADLHAWLEADEEDAPEVARDVGVVLVSEDFSQEITTTVLWLNELHDFDIRCVRLSPYKLGDRLLLDAQHVIPLPEASAYTIRVREKENSVKQAKASSSDWTKFVVQTPGATTEPLPKKWAILRLVAGLVEAGVSMDLIRTVLPPSKTISVVGTYDNVDDLWHAVQSQHQKPEPKRWHLADPIVVGDETWVLHANWGLGTRGFFDGLLELAPPGFAVYEEGDAPTQAV